MSIARHAIIALALALLGAGSAGFAQTPAAKGSATPDLAAKQALPKVNGVDGRWEGKLTIGQAALTVVFRFHTDAAGTQAVLDSPDQGASDIPVTALARNGDQLTVTIGSIGATYTGKLGADAKTLSGSWSQLGQSSALDLVQKAAIPAPHPGIQGLDGVWSGEIDSGAGALAIVVTVITDKNGTSATLQAPQQSPAAVPVSALTRDGKKVKFSLPAFGASWEGDLSADGPSMPGLWLQSGATSPLDLKRKP